MLGHTKVGPRAGVQEDAAGLLLLSPVHVNWPSNAHFVERRIVGRTAEQRGDDGAGARPLKSSFQRSAISFQLSPERDALGRPDTARHARRAENPQGARQSTVGDRRHYASRHYTHTGPVVFACPAASVASGVNAPERRPSVNAASAHRRRARSRAAWR